jgi:ribonucleotide monophosphatase NagD (HAD superfamily)
MNNLLANVDVAAIAIRTAADQNGALFLGSAQGEELVQNVDTAIVIEPNFVTAANFGERVVFTDNQYKAFLALNAFTLITGGMPLADAIKVAYARYLVIREGYASNRFAPAAHHVTYTDVVATDDASIARVVAGANVLVGMNALLTEAVKADIRDTFIDRVCTVAFVFRVRGHHYIADYQSIYDRVWRKTRIDANRLRTTWQHFAVNAIHAIYPVHLDRIWEDAVQNRHCNGALIKRFISAPAGVAGVYVVRQGIDDVSTVAPGIRTTLNASAQYLDTIIAELKKARFNGSINARYYGASHVDVDEKQLGAAGAVIRAALEGLDPNAPLGKSPALARIASNAPITGAVLARGIMALPTHKSVVNGLLES